MKFENAVELFFERESEFKDEIIRYQRQDWKVIPAGYLAAEWRYNARTGNVHEMVILRFEDIVVNAVVKLYINSFLFSAQMISGYDYFFDYIPEEWTEEFFDAWIEENHAIFVDNDGNTRYSDAATDKLCDLALELLAEDDLCKKLYWIDRILCVSHLSTDLAEWFVEGGSSTLNLVKDQIV